MNINVNLATNRLQLETFDGGNLYSSVTYVNIVSVSDGKDVNRLVTAPTPSGAPTTTTTQDDFVVWLHLADQKAVAIPLAYVSNQPGWLNTQAGFEQAEDDIYAAFPSAGGGGSGTVTIVDPGTTGLTVANATTTPTLGGTNPGGNGVADSGKVATYGANGGLHGSSTIGGTYGIRATSTGFGQGALIAAADGKGLEVSSSTGIAGSFDTNDEIAIVSTNDSATQPNLDVTQSGAGDIAHLDGPTGGVHILNDGGLTWTSGTGAATTRTNLGITNALLTAKTGAALTFDVQAEYNTAASPSSAAVSVNFTGAVAGTSIVCWFNHGAIPTWPAGFTVGGNAWNNGGLNCVLFTYRTGTTVSGWVTSAAPGAYVNPQINTFLTPAGTDYSVTVTTATALPGFSWTILAGKRYRYRQVLRVSATATGGVLLGLYFSAGTGQLVHVSGTTNTSTAGQANIYSMSTASPVNSGFNSQGTDRGSVSVSTRGYIILDGTIIGGTLDCTMDLRFSSFLAGQNATIYNLGSEISVTLLD